MARRHRQCIPDMPMHIVQRGNNRQPCFVHRNDYARYLEYLDDAMNRYAVSIHAYVLMTNHVHLLATPSTDDGISRMMQFLGASYVLCFNRIHSRTGTLWEGRFKSFLVSDDRYLLACYRYIELNPVRAGLAESPGRYPWSSYRANARGAASSLVRPHALYTELGNTLRGRCAAYRKLFDSAQDDERVAAIRAGTR
jgi:putative transposase